MELYRKKNRYVLAAGIYYVSMEVPEYRVVEWLNFAQANLRDEIPAPWVDKELKRQGFIKVEPAMAA